MAEISEKEKLFWGKMAKILGENNPWLPVTHGYIEIISHGITYRSFHVGGREIFWISWVPYDVVEHYSLLFEPNVSVKVITLRTDH